MKRFSLPWSVFCLSCLPAAGALAQQPPEAHPGEPVHARPTYEMVESMREAELRDEAARKTAPDADMYAQGAHGIPPRGAAIEDYERGLYAVNLKGDTNVGIAFPGLADVKGAYFFGQGAEEGWTTAVRVLGYRDGRQVGDTGWFGYIGSVPAWFEMELVGVDRIEVISLPVLDGGGWYGMDDLTFTIRSEDEEDDAEVVVTFDDLSPKTRLCGTGYAGLTWEQGTGTAYQSGAIHHPMAPPGLEEEATGEGESAVPASAPTEAATLPEWVFDFQGSKRGDTGSWSYPADTMGAIGPNHFVITVNRIFAVYDRQTGSRLTHMRLGSFLPGSNGDPRVLFDQHSGRWIVIVCDFNTRIYLAVSTTDDPMESWFKTSILVSDGSDEGCWPDYPTLGVDARGIYTSAYMVGCNMSIFALDKAPLIAPAPSLGTVTAFRGLTWEGAIQPAHTYGDPGAEYFVSARGDNQRIRVRRLDGPLTAPTLSTIASVSVGSWSYPPDAPALGSSIPLDTVGDRLMMAVYRDGSIWTTHTVEVGGRSAVRWYQIETSGPSLVQSGTVADDTVYFSFPSIMVNAAGTVALGFSGSHWLQYASCYYTGRTADDPAGAMAEPVLFKEGRAVLNLIDDYNRNRFGDYSYTTLDPLNELGLWTIQKYAEGTDIWGTWIARLSEGDCNENGIADECDIDCGATGGPCDVPGCGTSDDCNGNGLPDECDIAEGRSDDFNENGVPDECGCEGVSCPDSDVCTYAICVEGDCMYNAAPYGDVTRDETVNVFDVLCQLDVIAGRDADCTLEDCDIEPCEPNGSLNVFDFFAVLGAIAGTDPCCSPPP